MGHPSLIAEDRNERVVVIERRNHIGGNSYSEIDQDTSIEFHSYGSHIFHTSIKITKQHYKVS